MKKSELEKMMVRARELSSEADPQTEMLAMLVTLSGEILLQMGEIKRLSADFGPKLDATARAVAELEEKVEGKMAITSYDFGEKPDDK